MNSSRAAAVETRRKRQTAKSPRTRTRSAGTTADRACPPPDAGRADSSDSGRRDEADSGAEAKLARLSVLWSEYDALTKRDWVCNRAMDLRAEIRALLRSPR